MPLAPPALHPVLCLRVRDRLPLHVRRAVGPAAGERDDMVHNVTGPAVRVARLTLEIPFRLGAPLEPAAPIARTGHRRRPGRSLV